MTDLSLDERSARFLNKVAELCLEPQRRATLWRNRGETLETAREVGWLYGWLPAKGDAPFFLAATLLAGDRAALDFYKKQTGDARTLPLHAPQSVGLSLSRMAVARGAKQAEGSASEGRLRRLLDARLDFDGSGELPFLLRQTVTQLTTSDSKPQIHWPRLLADLIRWNSPYKTVQKRWARDFYGVQNLPDTSAETHSTETMPEGDE